MKIQDEFSFTLNSKHLFLLAHISPFLSLVNLIYGSFFLTLPRRPVFDPPSLLMIRLVFHGYYLVMMSLVFHGYYLMMMSLVFHGYYLMMISLVFHGDYLMRLPNVNLARICFSN